MSRNESSFHLYVRPAPGIPAQPLSIRETMGKMDVFQASGVNGVTGVNIEALPFSINDTTAGTETELQAVVVGDKHHVDLPIIMEQSNYFANIIRRSAAGDLKKKAVTELETFINGNKDGVWENSWVRFPKKVLGSMAWQTLLVDLLADKTDPSKGKRTDSHRFLFMDHGQEFIRIPISYLLKLSLAEAVDPRKLLPSVILEQGRALMDHFLSDNTSPETCSFHVTPLKKESGMGRALARETAKRFLLTQLLVMYANEKFTLKAGGQRAMIFFSPHPPIRQRNLNACISDAFYRELFMNPCLSGWNRGEIKQEYMHMCHRVLSRSQLNAVAKLREAGVINSNLVVMPNTSNISLANNGIHISFGSRKIDAMMADASSGFSTAHEKYVGDLVIKVLEHFLPLFVGTYSAAPYRLDFPDFHPENVLGFLPHELDFTHLRMLWRRWQKKAKLKIFGGSVTPFGPLWLDKALSALFGLKGDFIPDFRLIDYLVALMSTEKSPALDGSQHNHDRLKQDLSDLGIFDKHMSLYSFIKLREYSMMGFSGFESRHYSLFPGFEGDMARAVDLQNLLHALAYKYIALGDVSHSHIPDNPFIESERRQIIFGCAVGIPTFFIRNDTANQFLKKIVTKAQRIRPSRRYPGYLRVYHKEYCRALIRILQEDGADLIELFDMQETVNDLALRINEPERYGASGKLTKGILNKAGSKSPMSMKGDEFNKAAEDYYRNDLRKDHLREAWQFFEHDVQQMKSSTERDKGTICCSLHEILTGHDVMDFVTRCKENVIEEQVSADVLEKLLHLLILTIHADGAQSNMVLTDKSRDDFAPTKKRMIL